MMNKYAVDDVRRMQEAALRDVKAKLQNLRAGHTKTASEIQEIDRLEQQMAELEQALAEQ